MKRKQFFSNGPFFETEERIKEFGNSMYASYALSQTMREFAKLKSEYASALSASVDETVLQAKRSELKYFESIIELTAHGIATVIEEGEITHD